MDTGEDPDNTEPIDLRTEFAGLHLAQERRKKDKKKKKAADSFHDAAGFYIAGAHENPGFHIPFSSSGSGGRHFVMREKWLRSENHLKFHRHAINHQLDKVIIQALRDGTDRIEVYRGRFNKKGNQMIAGLIQRRIQELLASRDQPDRFRIRQMGWNTGLDRAEVVARLSRMHAVPGGLQPPPPAAPPPHPPAAS
jgi:hypothetical protein